MALKKDIELSSGVIASHHRIVSTNIDWVNKNLSFTVGHYVNVDTRLGDKQPVESTRYRALDEAFPLTDGGAIQNEMYNYLKSLPEYEGAEDEIVN